MQYIFALSEGFVHRGVVPKVNRTVGTATQCHNVFAGQRRGRGMAGWWCWCWCQEGNEPERKKTF